MMTLGCDSPARTRARTSRPVSSGIQISRNARAKFVFWILRRASAPLLAAVTVYPPFFNMLEMAKRVARSSSATRILCGEAGAWRMCHLLVPRIGAFAYILIPWGRRVNHGREWQNRSLIARLYRL